MEEWEFWLVYVYGKEREMDVKGMWKWKEMKGKWKEMKGKWKRKGKGNEKEEKWKGIGRGRGN